MFGPITHKTIFVGFIVASFIFATIASIGGLYDPDVLQQLIGGIWISMGYYFRFVSEDASKCHPIITSSATGIGLFLIVRASSSITLTDGLVYWIDLFVTIGFGFLCLLIWYYLDRMLDAIPDELDRSEISARLFDNE